ncbi:Gfo/Idh/MocA family oxidoreductase [Candidatus Pelagibacter sp.]|nr:Gfo/Idh/MocA family oxidoreductase [Candidatus Pelagibacter sp.]
MYKFAIWSFSNHFQNKVLPSIRNNKKIKIKYIFTKRESKNLDLKNLKWLKNKKELKAKKDINFIYISSENANHFKDIKFALSNKINVICEKPICLKSSHFKELVKISKNKKVKFFEMIQYKYHPVFLELKKIINKNLIGKIKTVESEFKVPIKKTKDNFRFKRELGGGSLNDIGFYPISIMFTLFDSKKIKIIRTKLKKENKLDIRGNLFAENENQVFFKLGWGFKSLYKNFIKIKGTKGKIEVKFIFAKQVIQGAEIKINTPREKVIKIKKANQINLAFNDILQSNINDFRNKLDLSLKIIKIMEILRKK